jgi:CRP-like cAMP-binding protein
MGKAKAKGTTDRMYVVTKRSNAPKPFKAPESVCADILKIGKFQNVSPGTILFHKGDAPQGIFLVMEGRVALSAGDDPVRVTRVAEKGSLLGLPSTIRNRPYTLTAEAVTRVDMCCVSAEQFREMLKTNTDLGVTVVTMLAEEISALRKLAVYKA